MLLSYCSLLLSLELVMAAMNLQVMEFGSKRNKVGFARPGI